VHILGVVASYRSGPVRGFEKSAEQSVSHRVYSRHLIVAGKSLWGQNTEQTAESPSQSANVNSKFVSCIPYICEDCH
jgi:hypothetical protein